MVDAGTANRIDEEAAGGPGEALWEPGTFPIGERRVYLNYAGLAPMAAPVARAMSDMAMSLSTGSLAERGAWAAEERARAAVEALLGAPAGSVTLTMSTSAGLSLVASGVDWRSGDNVVTFDGEFPSNVYPWLALQVDGVQTRLVGRDGPRFDSDRLIAAIDERTRVVAVSWVQFLTGQRLDLAPIAKACRRVGALLVVDGIQGLGAVALDVLAEDIDVLASAAYKWLFGPLGIGFVYVRPGLAERLRPRLVGYRSVAHPEDFYHYDLVWAQGAHRFTESDPSPVLAAGLEAALQLFSSVGGAGVVAARVAERAEQLRAGLHALGLAVVPDDLEVAERSGIVSVDPLRSVTEGAMGAASDRLSALQGGSDGHGDLATQWQVRLEAKGVDVASRGGLLRLSPHASTTRSEIDAVLNHVGEFRSG